MKSLAIDLRNDAQALQGILQKAGEWNEKKDAKLNALVALITKTHPNEKILVFSQFADTVRYLEAKLKAAGVKRLAGVTGDSSDPRCNFSPKQQLTT